MHYLAGNTETSDKALDTLNHRESMSMLIHANAFFRGTKEKSISTEVVYVDRRIMSNIINSLRSFLPTCNRNEIDSRSVRKNFFGSFFFNLTKISRVTKQTVKNKRSE